MRRMLVGVLVVCALAFAAGDAAAKARKHHSTKKPTASRVVTRNGYSPMAWSHTGGPAPGPASAIGGYAAGCLAGGVALPAEGPGYQVIRLSRQRNYGHPALVDFLRGFGRKVAAAGLGTALIGDMSQARGGPMSFGHASHQIGLDADIWLRLDQPPMGHAAREHLEEIKYVDYDRRRVTGDWSERQVELIRLAAADPRVARIFVSPSIKRALCERDWKSRDWLGKLRPWHGHDGHMHVRLSCPPGSPQCEEQSERPEGDGCDDDLQGWLRRAVPVSETPPAQARPRNPRLPEACYGVLHARGTRVAAAPARIETTAVD